MMRKILISCSIGGLFVLLASVAFYTKLTPSLGTSSSSDSARGKREVLPGPQGGGSSPSNNETPHKKSLAPWEIFSPLTNEEKLDYDLAQAQIVKLSSWGKLEKSYLKEFEGILLGMGDRAVAHTARDLANFSTFSIKEVSEVEAAIRKIDELAYFAKSNVQIAHESIRALALRPTNIDEQGNPLDPLKANITLGVFDLLAQYHPREALAHIKSIAKHERFRYFTHYASGRKLAGKSTYQINKEIRRTFGKDVLAVH